MNKEILETDSGTRTENQWQNLFQMIVEELGNKLAGKPQITCYTFGVLGQNASQFEVGVDVHIKLQCGINLCGVIGCQVNVNDIVYITAFLLPFIDGTRLNSDKKNKEVLILSYTSDGWSDISWEIDEHWEWESYTNSDRWESA